MKSIYQFLTLILILFFSFSSNLKAKPALEEKGLMTPTKWYWLTGVTADKVKAKVNQGYRIFDLEVESTSPYKFSAVMVKNSGKYKSGWWWYYGKTSQQVKTLLSQNKARIIDLQVYFVGGQKRYAVVMVPNTGSNAKGWWYYSELSFDDLGKKLAANKARAIDIDTYVKGGKRFYTSVMIANKGADSKGWWYYSNLSASQLKQKLSSHKARITDIEVRNIEKGAPKFTVVLEKTAGETWWWYYGKSMAQVNQLADQNGARLIDVTPYIYKGKKRFAVVIIKNVNAQTDRMRKYLSTTQNGGTYGIYLKKVGGSELVNLMGDKQFYPASTIKVLEHVHAMRAIQSKKASLNTQVIKFENGSQSCADSHRGHKATKLKMEVILREMMEKSDNQSTNAVQEYFGGGNASKGRAAINQTAYGVLKLSRKTKLNHKLGCGGPKNDPANTLILKDIAKLYEKVETGALTGTHKAKFYELMLTGKSEFQTIADQEGKKLGLSSSVINSFKSGIKTGAKAGSFTSDGKKFSSVGGWVSLPVKSGTAREYTFGYYRDRANSIKEGYGAWAARGELLREQIRSALKTYKSPRRAR